MTQPAEITSRHDWELLRSNHREIYLSIDDLYQRITDPGADDDAGERHEKEDPMPEPEIDPDADVQAEEEIERQERLDDEFDGDLDGDYEPDYEPGMED